MTNIQPAQLLQTQHRMLDINLQRLQTEQANSPLLYSTLQLLLLHIYIEEELLFPLLNQRQLAMPLGVMRAEHGQMWDLIEQAGGDLNCATSNSLEAVAPPLTPTTQQACRALFELCAQHNPKEEDIIYPAIDNFHVNDQEPGSLIDDINTAQRPAAWVCAARR